MKEIKIVAGDMEVLCVVRDKQKEKAILRPVNQTKEYLTKETFETLLNIRLKIILLQKYLSCKNLP